MQHIPKNILAIVLGFFLSTHASAATIIVTLPDFPTEAFDNPGFDDSSNAVELIIGDEFPSGIIRKTPWTGDLAETGTYTSIQGGGFATYEPGLFSEMSFVWGTPDDYNVLVLDRVGQPSLKFVILPSSAGGPAELAFGDERIDLGDIYARGSAFINIDGNGSLFTKARFSSSTNAFEIGNLAFEVVPLPASSLLLLAGLGGLAAMKRRKSK